MSENLEQKFANLIKENNEALTASVKALEVAVEKGATKEEIDNLKNEIAGYNENIEKMQTQLDEIATEQKKNATDAKKSKDSLKHLIQENYDDIKNVRKGNTVNIETKAVGNMTTANLTGDEQRDYAPGVVALPGQALNVADLIMPVTIEGGTYTFMQETGGEGAPATQTEGNDKAQVDYDFEAVDVTTDFIAGFAVYSKKMANNLPFLESFLPQALRRDYWIAENSAFNTTLAAGVTASTQVITSKNKVEMLINELATLEAANYMPNVMVIRPADFYDILKTEKSTGAGYGLPGVVTFDNGQMRINGIPVIRANWLAANKYYVGDFTYVKKIITEGLSVEFSNSDEDNFRKNNITARVEAQVGLAIERASAIIYGDFTAT